jgi:hypothetical protein
MCLHPHNAVGVLTAQLGKANDAQPIDKGNMRRLQLDQLANS